MSKPWQIYYNTIFGAIGGLSAWLIVGLISTSSWNVHLANLFTGAGVGLFIGGALGVVEGLLVKRSVVRTLTGGLGGVFAGLTSGMMGLYMGGLVFCSSRWARHPFHITEDGKSVDIVSCSRNS